MSNTKTRERSGLFLSEQPICARPAASHEELEQAFRLVYASYLSRGYVQPGGEPFRLSIFEAFPDTITFVGISEGEVVATVSLVVDTPIGLPMDAIYHPEMQALRDAGRKLTEATMLADRRSEIKRTLPMLLLMMKRLFDYATLAVNANDICITVNPRHCEFYDRYLLFTPLGEERPYPSVEGNPALAKRLNLDSVREQCEGNRNLLRTFFENRTDPSAFENRYRMAPADLREFLVERSHILREVSEETITYLKKVRSDCPWDEWRRAAGNRSLP